MQWVCVRLQFYRFGSGCVVADLQYWALTPWALSRKASLKRRPISSASALKSAFKSFDYRIECFSVGVGQSFHSFDFESDYFGGVAQFCPSFYNLASLLGDGVPSFILLGDGQRDFKEPLALALGRRRRTYCPDLCNDGA